jgi:16S rRNA A1518/A1519 N6-dimethyltransferase RsmA/KsgA/DIM1 with predicted DNA glycosylase/AP lyase activity
VQKFAGIDGHNNPTRCGKEVFGTPGHKIIWLTLIFLQSAYAKVTLSKVARNSFYPVLDVDSTTLFLAKKEHPFLFSREVKWVIQEIFTNRRKQISKLAAERNLSIEKWLDRNKFSSKAHPEQVPVGAWQDFQATIGLN